MPRQAGASFELGGKLSDEFTGKAHHFGESGYNWHNLERARLLKRYFSNEVRFCIKARCWFSERDRKDFRAFFRWNDRSWITKADDFDRGTVVQLRSANLDVLPDLGGGNNNDQQPVFVSDVEVMNGRHSVVVRNGMIVGLCPDNSPESSPANTLYISPITGLFEFFPTSANREEMIVQRALTVNAREGNNQMVQTGTQMVDDLAGDNRESERNGWTTKRLKDVLQLIVLEASYNFVRGRVATDESSDLRVEITDTFFGPLNLRLDTI